MVETADIVVIGGGCIRALIALHLAERKAGKILLEKKELANGASGKGIGIIPTHYTHPVLAELSRQMLGETNFSVEQLNLFRFKRFQENDWVKSPIHYSQAIGHETEQG